MSNPVVRKLEHGARLSDDDRRTLERLTADVRTFGPREDIIREGDQPDHVHVVLEGYAARYKVVEDGGRQIMAWLIPGDFCDLHVTILKRMDHSIACLSSCKVAFIARRDVEALTEGHGALTRALWWSTLVDEGILREWMVGMGRRSAESQIAHLFCELLLRLQSVGFAGETSFELPVTQEELADTVGMSAVHVNRVIQQLRADGLITLHGRSLTIHDVDRLKALAGFDPNYLHLEEPHTAAE